MTTIKKLGLLTSGGDCAGLNAAIRAVVHRATAYGWEVLGIRDGTQGLLDRPVRAERLDPRDMSATMMRMGGTILGTTNKGNPFFYPQPDGSVKDLSPHYVEGMKMLELDALIGIGGDGSLDILNRLVELSKIPFVGIPKTMDNDVAATELSIGFHTAVAVATEALDRLQPTAASHARVMVLEVMGRDAGHVALEAGVAGGADVILIPEIPWSLESIAAKIDAVRKSGRNFALVVVSEAIKTMDGKDVRKDANRYGGVGEYIARVLSEKTGAETRVTVLGHVQRGSPPTHTDRLLGQAFGVHAVELLAAGKFGRMVAWNDRKVIDVPLSDVVAKSQTVNLAGSVVRTARGLGICLGD
jgi:phosphofructokinase-like protein